MGGKDQSVDSNRDRTISVRVRAEGFLTNDELLELASETRDWLMSAAPLNVAALDQIKAVLRDVVDNYGVSPTSDRDALLLTLGALYITSQVMELAGCEHSIPVRVSICAGLGVLTEFCESRVGGPYFRQPTS